MAPVDPGTSLRASPPDVALLGVFGPERRRIAVLKDSGGGVANVLEHDLVQGRFRVLDIDRQSIQLHNTAAPGAAPIRLGPPEPAPLRER